MELHIHMKVRLLLTIFGVAIAGIVHAQAFPLWTLQNSNVRTNNNAWTVTIGQLGGNGVRCLQVTNAGLLQVASAGCGSGAGGGGGGGGFNFGLGYIWNSTTTDQILIGAIATTSIAKLEVIGNGYFSGGSYPILGLGTTTSNSEFAVQGGGLFSGNLTAANMVATGTLTVTGASTFNGAMTVNNATVFNSKAATSSTTYCIGLSGTQRLAGCNGTAILNGYLYSPFGNGTINATTTGFFSNVIATGTLSVEGSAQVTGSQTIGGNFQVTGGIGTGGYVNTAAGTISASTSFAIGADTIIVHPYTPNADNDARTNIGVGVDALGKMVPIHSTQFNSAFGVGALSSAINTDHLTAIGAYALEAATTSPTTENTTALGIDALRYNTDGGQENVAVGEHAMVYSRRIDKSTCAGVNCLGNMQGVGLTALGYYAGSGSTTAQESVYIGYFAMPLLAQNTYNNANNYSSGNISIGSLSGFSVATGSNNIIIGYHEGVNLLQGSDNVLISTATSSNGISNLTSGDQNIALGSNLSFASSTGSNQLNIGNIIFGTNINGTGLNLSTGNIGIATTSPYARLSVVGQTVSSYFTATTTGTAANNTFPNLVSTNGTTTNSTSTQLFATNASTTNFYGANLNTCTSGNVLTWSDGKFGCAGAIASYDAFTHPTISISATTSQILINSASSTITFLSSNFSTSTQATSTYLAVTGNASTTQLTVSGTATSTFGGGIATKGTIDSQSTTASSTFSNGITLSKGCFAIGQNCLTIATTTSGGVFSVVASNASLTISPNVGGVLASLNVGNANTWTAQQTINGAGLLVNNSTSTITNLNVGTLSASSTVFITATTTLYSGLVFDSVVAARPSYVIFSPSNSNMQGIHFATTTSNIIFMIDVATGTQSNITNFPRISIGTTTPLGLIATSTLVSGGLRAQLTVAGDVYTRRYLGCDYPGMMIRTAIGATNNFICGFGLNSTNGGIVASNFEYPPFLRLKSQPASPSAGQANAVGDGSAIIGFGGLTSTSSPVFEGLIRNPSYFATNTITMIGFGTTTGAFSTANFNKFNTEPTNGAYFVMYASSTNWTAVARNNTNNVTYFDTGVATSSNPFTRANFQRFRIELTGSTTATFLINGNIVAIANTTTPAVVLYPFISFSSNAAAAYAPNNGVVEERYLDISQFRLWSD